MNGVLNWFNPNWPEKSALQLKYDAALSSVATKDGGSDGVNSMLAGVSGLPGLAPVMPWGPVIDGTDVGTKDMPHTRLRDGQGNYVPTIWGSNLNEGTIFVPLIALVVKGGSYPLDAKSLNLTLLHFFDKNQTMVNAVLNLYPLGDYKNSQDSRAASILRDCFFSCAMRRGARAMDQHGSKAWLYHFEFPMDNPLYPLLGNFHASELGFVFGSWLSPFSKSHDMSASFQRYWGNLANSGDVNVDSGAQLNEYQGTPSTTFWPNHNSSTDFNIVMDIPTSTQQHLYSKNCDFWDANVKP
jgi:para-nitrobenzyl esterase